MTFRSIVSVTLLSATFALTATAQTPKAPAANATAKPASPAAAANRANTRKLLSIIGATALSGQVIDTVVGDIRRNVPQVPDTFWRTFRSEMPTAAFEDRLVAVYEKNFTPTEIAELLRFYSSPVGRRFVAQQAPLSQDTMVAARAWGQQIAQRAMQRLNEKGYIQKAQKR